MKSTIRTEAGVCAIESHVGRVSFNGGSMLPHEAFLIASELARAADTANKSAQAAADEAMKAAA